MRKIATTITVIALLLTAGITISSCGAGTFLQTVGSGGTLANVFTSVIGLDKVTEKGLVGTWKYEGPGCAFTSENLLAKAGGEVAATKARRSRPVSQARPSVAHGPWTRQQPRCR